MIPKLVCVSIVFGLLFPLAVQADSCTGLLALKRDVKHAAEQIEKTAPAACGSYRTVAKSLLDGRKRGGRKLKEDEGFRAEAAQQDLAEALADPAVKDQLNKGREEISDPALWLFYEAAVFDTEGYYDARDLRIQQLSADSP